MPTHTAVEKTCRECRKTFRPFPSEIRRGGGIFCSTICYHKTRERPLATRFWEKVRKTETCWVWVGAHAHEKHSKWRYGILSGGKTSPNPKQAHRISWELHFGPIPKGKLVLHRCDNAPCVRPDHLFLGTFLDNTHDMLNKRRHIVKLTDDQVADLRQQYASGRVSQMDLAAAFGLGQSTVSRIIRHANRY